MMRKRGYLWVDWVELGCRGWDLEEYGAELSGSDEQGFAVLERYHLRVHLVGPASFLWRALRDLRAAGLDVPDEHTERVFTVYPQTGTQTLPSGSTLSGLPTIWRHVAA